jgi:signal transduction histidine kinase
MTDQEQTTTSPAPQKGASGSTMRLTTKLRLVAGGMIVALFCTVLAVVWSVETGRAYSTSLDLASNCVRDIDLSVRSVADSFLLNTAHLVANAVGSVEASADVDLDYMLKLYALSEIHVINSNGIIVASTVPKDRGWDMAGGEQSAEFLRLLHGEKEYAQPLQPKSNGGAETRYVGVTFPVGSGFLQAALDGEAFNQDLRRRVVDVTTLVRIRNKGYVVLADEDGSILSAPAALQSEIGGSLETFLGMSKEEIANAPAGLFDATVKGEPCYCHIGRAGSFRAVVVQPEHEVFAAREALVPALFCAELPLFFIFFVIVNWLLRRYVADDVARIDSALARISAGDLDASVDVRSSAEMASISDSINAAASSLRHHAALERERLQRERDQAIAAEKSRNFFFASVSHDIRTPLNSIIGFSQLLKLGVDDDEKRRRYLDSIVQSGEMLMQIINDVLDLSKLEADKMVFTPEWCDIGDLVSAMLSAFDGRASAEDITLSSKVPPNLPEFLVDPHRLRQILFNLLGNAVKFTHGGFVRVVVKFSPSDEDCHRGILEIAVRDNGVGISPENLEKLGRPFVQLEKGTGQMQGTGLGLAICRQMLSRMGGELKIESKLGSGSTFTVRLLNVESRESTDNPLATLPPSETTTPQDNDDSWKKQTVLLVDDVPLNLSILSMMCRRLGVESIGTAKSAQEALELLHKGAFDLVLTDLWMPGMDGAALLAAIRDDEALRHIPVYAVSADVELLKSFERIGFNGILLKPVLLDNLRRLLSSR